MKKIAIMSLAAVLVLAGFFCWSGAPNAKALIQTNASADVVVGQQDMTSNSPNQGSASAANNTLYEPRGVFSDGNKMIVADYTNNRVLIYNSIPTGNNASADVVLGQADMASNLPNRGGAVSANTFYLPIGVFYDGTRLFVADYNNSRVLIYNSVPTANNAGADVVVGQADFTHNEDDQGGAVSANGIDQFHQIWVDTFRFFGPDAYNNRLLIYNLGPEFTLTKNHSAAFAGGERVKVAKKKITLWGKKKTFKKGRIRIFQNGVLKKIVKIKKSGSWKTKFKDSESAMRSYKFKYYTKAGSNTESSRTYVFRINRTGVAATAVEKPANVSVPEKSSSSSAKKEKEIWGADFSNF